MREAVIRLSDRELEAIGPDGVVAATREAGLLDVTELVCHGAGRILQVRVEEPVPEADLDRFESVLWWERLTDSAPGVTYLCKVEPRTTPTALRWTNTPRRTRSRPSTRTGSTSPSSAPRTRSVGASPRSTRPG